jgi:hypothetical protein
MVQDLGFLNKHKERHIEVADMRFLRDGACYKRTDY